MWDGGVYVAPASLKAGQHSLGARCRCPAGGEYGYESEAELDYDRLSYEVRLPRMIAQQWAVASICFGCTASLKPHGMGRDVIALAACGCIDLQLAEACCVVMFAKWDDMLMPSPLLLLLLLHQAYTALGDVTGAVSKGLSVEVLQQLPRVSAAQHLAQQCSCKAVPQAATGSTAAAAAPAGADAAHLPRDCSCVASTSM